MAQKLLLNQKIDAKILSLRVLKMIYYIAARKNLAKNMMIQKDYLKFMTHAQRKKELLGDKANNFFFKHYYKIFSEGQHPNYFGLAMLNAYYYTLPEIYSKLTKTRISAVESFIKTLETAFSKLKDLKPVKTKPVKIKPVKTKSAKIKPVKIKPAIKTGAEIYAPKILKMIEYMKSRPDLLENKKFQKKFKKYEKYIKNEINLIRKQPSSKFNQFMIDNYTEYTSSSRYKNYFGLFLLNTYYASLDPKIKREDVPELGNLVVYIEKMARGLKNETAVKNAIKELNNLKMISITKKRGQEYYTIDYHGKSGFSYSYKERNSRKQLLARCALFILKQQMRKSGAYDTRIIKKITIKKLISKLEKLVNREIKRQIWYEKKEIRGVKMFKVLKVTRPEYFIYRIKFPQRNNPLDLSIDPNRYKENAHEIARLYVSYMFDKSLPKERKQRLIEELKERKQRLIEEFSVPLIIKLKNLKAKPIEPKSEDFK